MNVEQLRKQAKELVRAARAQDPEALARLGGREPILARAQLVLAREHGYPSWAALVAAAEANAEAFVVAATSGRRARAEAMLAARPDIARDPWAQLVLGDHRPSAASEAGAGGDYRPSVAGETGAGGDRGAAGVRGRAGWRGDPNAPGGPRGWAPLLYVCHSCFASAALARELLDAGADPNACFVNEYGEMSALYGAAGVVHDPELTRVLLEAGADPNDGESLYHATEAESPECVRLLLAHGAIAEPIHAAHALDEPRAEHVRLLLDAGADPTGLLAHAVRRGQGPEVLRLLVEHGADLDRPGGETWRGNVPLRSPYAHAVLRGRDDQAQTLAALGASTEVPREDLAVAAIARGERVADPLPAELDVDAQEVLILAALRGKLDLVVEHVGPDFRGVVGGSPAGTLLHHAAWVGNPDLIRRLLAHGADPNARADTEYATPLGWAALASQYHELPNRDFVGVAEVLAAAGNPIESRLLDIADGPLAEWLEERTAATG